MDIRYYYKNIKDKLQLNKFYYFTLVVAVVSSYSIMSIKDMEFITYLYEDMRYIVSNIYRVYIVSLFFLVIIIYTAINYQLNERGKELGLMLAFGMTKNKLIGYLIKESFINTGIALIFGLPLGIFLNEFLNLFATSLLQLGLSNHRFRISSFAIFSTILIINLLQIIGIYILGKKKIRGEPAKLLNPTGLEKKYRSSREKAFFYKLGLFMVGVFVITAIFGLSQNYIVLQVFLLFFGLFLYYMGFGYKVKRKGRDIFLYRQFQEKFIMEYKSLYISTVLLIWAFTFLANCTDMVIYYKSEMAGSVDFTVVEDKEKIAEIYKRPDLQGKLKNPDPIYLQQTNSVDATDFNDLVMQISDMRKDYMGYSSAIPLWDFSLVIKEKSYNTVLYSAGENLLNLKHGECAIYLPYKSLASYCDWIVREYYSGDIYIYILGRPFKVVGVYSVDLFSNDQVMNSSGVVVDDDFYNYFALDKEPYAWNINIDEDFVKEEGYVSAADSIRDILFTTDYRFESYVWKVKRNVSSIIDSLYSNLYLAIMFFILTNLFIGLKFMIYLRRNRKRYEILLKLGGEMSQIKTSIKKLVRTYFGNFLFLSVVFGSLLSYIAIGVSYGRGDIFERGEFFKIMALIIIVYLLLELIFVKVFENIAIREAESLKVDRK